MIPPPIGAGIRRIWGLSQIDPKAMLCLKHRMPLKEVRRRLWEWTDLVGTGEGCLEEGEE